MGLFRNIRNAAQGAVNRVQAVTRQPFNQNNWDPRRVGGFSNPNDGTARAMGGMSMLFGQDPGAIGRMLGFQDADKTMQQGLLEKTTNENRALVKNALEDANIDDISKDEIGGMFQAGARLDEVTKKISDAREGKGMYAVRKVNQSQKKQIAEAPGRRQLLAVRRGV